MSGVTRARSKTLVPPARSILLAFTVLIWAHPSWSQEARCLELGDGNPANGVCACSEPLDSPAGPISQIYSDPPDSPDAWECNSIGSNPNPISGLGSNQYTGGFSTALEVFSSSTRNFGNASYVPASGVEVPLPGVTNVLQVVHPAGGNVFLLDYEFTDSTWCVRRYTYYDDSEWPDAPLFNGNQDIKLGRHLTGHGGANPYVQCVMMTAGVGCAVSEQFSSVFGYGPNLGGQNTWAGKSNPKVDFNDFQKSWVRIEQCYDHNSRNGGDADKLVRRMRVTKLDGKTPGEVSIFPDDLSPNSHFEAWTGTGTQATSFTTPDWKDQAFPNGARTFHSHYMVAMKRPADESFWIGPASEIEGGGGGPPPPPPPATAPQAPILLP